jgi:prepilin-type N-terminal cleavage/methylation domain-containing protein
MKGSGDSTVRNKRYRGFSLLELLAVVTILGVLAVIIVPRISIPGYNAKSKVCDQYVSDINAAIERYYFDNGTFPTTLGDLTPNYYPEAIPPCPANGAPYAIDGTTHSVTPHNHGS